MLTPEQIARADQSLREAIHRRMMEDIGDFIRLECPDQSRAFLATLGPGLYLVWDPQATRDAMECGAKRVAMSGAESGLGPCNRSDSHIGG